MVEKNSALPGNCAGLVKSTKEALKILNFLPKKKKKVELDL